MRAAEEELGARVGEFSAPLEEKYKYYRNASKLPNVSKDWDLERLPEFKGHLAGLYFKSTGKYLLGPLSWFYLPGAFFVFWEGLTLTMTIKAARQLNYQEDIGAETIEGKEEEFQDWLVLLVFNHLVAGAEAFVSAHMWDFPVELGAQPLPGGNMGFGMRVNVLGN